jgi:ribose transport system permease protein
MMSPLIGYFRREPATLVAMIVLAVVVGVWLILTPSLSIDSFTSTLSQKTPLAMLAIGETIVIVTRGIDLSVGGTLALVNVIIAKGSESGGSVIFWTTVAIVTALVVGLVNGIFVAYFRLPALIVTLATLSILSGLALYVLPTPGGGVPGWFSDIPMTLIGPVPLAAVLLVVIPLVIWLPIRRARIGTALYAVGNDATAAFVSGIKVKRTTAFAYVLSALFAALGGIFVTMITVSGDASIGAPYTLNSIAAAVLGGALLTGGRGTIAGAVAGAFILSFITNLLFVLGVSSYWQYVVTGALLVAALAIPFLMGQLRSRKSVAK